jgi:hypothetical protein
MITSGGIRHMPATTHPVTQQELAEALDKFRVQLLADIEALVSLPFDEEPISPELENRILEATANIERGEGITTEQLNRELGL